MLQGWTTKNFHKSAHNPVCSISSLDWTTNNLTMIEFFLSIQFQTTSPKSCYMRPPGGELVPGESIIATGKSPNTISSFPKLLLASSRLPTIRNLIVGSVFKFVEPLECREQAAHPNNKVKFKIMSMKMDADQHYQKWCVCHKLLAIRRHKLLENTYR